MAEGRLRARIVTYDTVNRPIQRGGNSSIDVFLRLVLKKIYFVSRHLLVLLFWIILTLQQCKK